MEMLIHSKFIVMERILKYNYDKNWWERKYPEICFLSINIGFGSNKTYNLNSILNLYPVIGITYLFLSLFAH